MTYDKIKKDIQKILKTNGINNQYTFNHYPTYNLYSGKYILHIRIDNLFLNFKMLPNGDYDEFLDDIKRHIIGRPRNYILPYINIHAPTTDEDMKAIIENAATEEKMHSLIPTKILNKKPPRGSLKYRAKITTKYWINDLGKKDVATFLENIETMFGTDDKSDVFCKCHGLTNFNYCSSYIYVNFSNIDDAMMLIPFINDPVVISTKLVMYNG